MTKISKSNCNIMIISFYQRGFRPLNPDLLFVLTQKVGKKVKTAPASLERPLRSKNYAQLAKTVQTRSFVAQTGRFFTPTSLVFRLTGRGRSLATSIWKIYNQRLDLSF